MKILTPYGIECFARVRTRRQRLWAWIKGNSWFVILQALGIAMLPVVFFLSAYFRGYHAIGSEVLICFTPLIYRGYKWLMNYDEEDDI